MRPWSSKRDKAKQLWLDSGKKRQLKDIAAELQVFKEQVRKWKNQDKLDKVTLPIIEAGSWGIRTPLVLQGIRMR